MPAKTVLVGGGAGGVGEGIVRELLAAGHRAVVPSRSAAKLEALRRHLEPEDADRLLTLVGHVGEPEGARELRERLAHEVGRIDVAIASLGGWSDGKTLLEMTIADWDAVMDEMLRTHVVFAQAFVPMLVEQGGGRYIGIGGGAAYLPIPGAATVCMAAAAQLMMTRALRAEIDDPAVEILELVVDGPVRTRPFESIAQPDWITAAEVGAIVMDLVLHGRTDAPSTRTRGPIVRMFPREPTS